MATTQNFLLAWARRPAAWLVAAALPLLGAATLSSCGGGAVALAALGGVGTGGTGLTIGTVVAFGSVGVDGQEYDSETPKYYQNSDSSQVAATSVGLGDRMRVETSGNSPVAMTVEPSLIGPIQGTPAINADSVTGSFVVNGVTVTTNIDPAKGPVTFYVGLTKFADLTAGMPVEVHGLFGIDASGNGYIQATRIVQLPSSNQTSQITGIVSNLASHSSGQTFTVQGSGTVVQLTSNTSLLTAGVALADGQVVNVSSAQPLSGGTITAATLRIHSLVGVNATVQVEGLLATGGTTGYLVDGIPVDLSASGLLNGTGLSTWVPGAYVVTGQPDSTGILHATTVRAYSAPGAGAQVSLKGTITGYVNNSNFLVRGVLVNVPSSVALPSTLGNGIYVEIAGNPGGVTTDGTGQGDQVIATGVTTASTAPPAGATVDYLGTVSGYNASGGTFLLTAGTGTTYPAGTSMSVTLTSNAVYVNGSASNLATSGTPVEVEGTYANGSLTVYSVTFLGAAPSSAETQGVVTGLSGANFSVNGVALTWTTGTTTFCHDCNGTPTTAVPTWFVNGANVSVNYTNSGPNAASTISLEN